MNAWPPIRLVKPGIAPTATDDLGDADGNVVAWFEVERTLTDTGTGETTVRCVHVPLPDERARP